MGNISTIKKQEFNIWERILMIRKINRKNSPVDFTCPGVSSGLTVLDQICAGLSLWLWRSLSRRNFLYSLQLLHFFIFGSALMLILYFRSQSNCSCSLLENFSRRKFSFSNQGDTSTWCPITLSGRKAGSGSGSWRQGWSYPQFGRQIFEKSHRYFLCDFIGASKSLASSLFPNSRLLSLASSSIITLSNTSGSGVKEATISGQ